MEQPDRLIVLPRGLVELGERLGDLAEACATPSPARTVPAGRATGQIPVRGSVARRIAAACPGAVGAGSGIPSASGGVLGWPPCNSPRSPGTPGRARRSDSALASVTRRLASSSWRLVWASLAAPDRGFPSVGGPQDHQCDRPGGRRRRHQRPVATHPPPRPRTFHDSRQADTGSSASQRRTSAARSSAVA